MRMGLLSCDSGMKVMLLYFTTHAYHLLKTINAKIKIIIIIITTTPWF
jgi:hypothetical protein